MHGTGPVQLCGAPLRGGSNARCAAWVQPASVASVASAGPPQGALTPAEFHRAYGLPTRGRRRQTVAIVTPYGAPTIARDLQTFSLRFGLPRCGVSSRCLRVVNQNGQSSPLPLATGDWPIEGALSVETVHGICPDCRLVLVAATSTDEADLGASVDTAARRGASEIVISFVSLESFNDQDLAPHYNHPGVVIVAASGDNGYDVTPGFPASAPTVIAVGGTHLNLKRNGSYGGESAWSSSEGATGSGCSSQFAAPRWQSTDAAAAGCGTDRATNDVAADGDPATGAAVYTSTPVPVPGHGEQRGWFQLGGTSLAAPLIAGVFALAGGTPRGVSPGATLYAHQRKLHDVTRGSNGSCGGRRICQAQRGYDGPTGIGSPNGLDAFTAR